MSTNARLGRDFLLKIGDSGSPETFSTVRRAAHHPHVAKQ